MPLVLVDAVQPQRQGAQQEPQKNQRMEDLGSAETAESTHEHDWLTLLGWRVGL